MRETDLKRLGNALDEYSKWYWLSFLVIPLIVFFQKVFEFLGVLKTIADDTKDPDLQAAYSKLSWSYTLFIFSFLSILAPLGMAFIILISWIMAILGWGSMAAWAEKSTQELQSPNLKQFVEGLKSAKTGTILMLFLIGIILVPMGLSKAAQGLLAEYPPEMDTQVTGQPNIASAPVQRTPVVQSQPQTPIQTPTYNQNPAPVPVGKGQLFCSSCGAPYTNPSTKFCGKCGQHV
jgi:hypothetical protein